MTIEETIKILQRDLDDPGSVAIEDLNKAQKISIEALEREKAERRNAWARAINYLPGETEN